MVSHSEPYSLECEVKWALRITAVNKASGCEEIPAGLFKSLKEDVIKVLHSLCQQIWKTWQWPQDWKRSVLISIPKKGSIKECANNQKIALISHASKVMLKILHARLQHYANEELTDVQAGFRKGRGTRDQIVNVHWIKEKPRKFQKTSISVWTTVKPLTVRIMTNGGKLLEKWEYQTILPVSWKTCMWIKKQQLEPCMEQQLIGSRSRKKYDRAVYCHPVCLTYMLSKSWLQSPSAVILEPPKIKSFTVTIVSPSICHEVMGPYAVIEAMKLKDACSLEEKLRPTSTAYLKQETLLFQ